MQQHIIAQLDYDSEESYSSDDTYSSEYDGQPRFVEPDFNGPATSWTHRKLFEGHDPETCPCGTGYFVGCWKCFNFPEELNRKDRYYPDQDFLTFEECKNLFGIFDIDWRERVEDMHNSEYQIMWDQFYEEDV